MMFMEIIPVYSKNHNKTINTLCQQHTELLNVKVGGTYSYHWALKD
jgi:lipoate-protein ligase B